MILEKELELAAEPARARLERDRAKLEAAGEAVLAAVLDYLNRNLFRPGLTAVAAARAAGTYPSWIAPHLRKHLGQSCHEYYAARRYETAKRMLASLPELDMDTACALVGGLRGKWLRRLCRECGRHSPKSSRDPASRPKVLRAPANWKRLAAGALTFAEQQQLGSELRDAFPESFTTTIPEDTEPAADDVYVPSPAIGLVDSIRDGGPVDGADLARAVAEHEVWPLLAGLPYDAQRLVVQRYLFTSPELFDLLREKSREEGRRDPQRGIELAELALLSLEVSAEALGERIHELRALGWAWIGNARRLALDFPGAEEAFAEAVAEIELVEEWESSGVAGDVYALRGSLRIFQRRFKEALELLDRSLDIFKMTGNRRRETEQLMKRAAAASYAGWSEMAISDLTMALGIVNALKDEALKLKVVISLGMALVNSGEFERGKAAVKDVAKRSCMDSSPLLLHQVQWIEGIAAHGLGDKDSAEKEYLEARAGFENLGQAFYVAFVDLDLAILYTETNRPDDVVRTSASALRFFEALTLGRETMVSLGLLKEALHHHSVTEAVLRDLRSSLRADPLVAFSKKAEPGPRSPGPKTIAGF